MFTPWPGIGTYRSRGIESIEIRCLPGSVCMITIESARASWSAFEPRLSEPITSVFCEWNRMLPPVGASAFSVRGVMRALALATSFENER